MTCKESNGKRPKEFYEDTLLLWLLEFRKQGNNFRLSSSACESTLTQNFTRDATHKWQAWKSIHEQRTCSNVAELQSDARTQSVCTPQWWAFCEVARMCKATVGARFCGSTRCLKSTRRVNENKRWTQCHRVGAYFLSVNTLPIKHKENGWDQEIYCWCHRKSVRKKKGIWVSPRKSYKRNSSALWYYLNYIVVIVVAKVLSRCRNMSSKCWLHLK